jgi:hypothetical protein
MTPKMRDALAAAAAREDGLLIPPDGPAAARTMLAKRLSAGGYCEAAPLPADAAAAWRSGEDGTWGLRISPAGREALAPPGAEPEPPEEAAREPGKALSRASAAAAARRAARAGKAPAEPAQEAPPQAEEAPAAPRPRRAPMPAKAALEAAAQGILPQPPDFTAETHKPHRKRLAAVVELVQAGDLEGLRQFQIKAVSSSPKAIIRYRDLAIRALEARATKA